MADYESMEDEWEERYEQEQASLEAEAQAYQDELTGLQSAFVAAAKTCDAAFSCTFAPLVHDYRGPGLNGKYPKRAQKLHELMVDVLNNHEMGAEIMGLLIEVAYGGPLSNAPIVARQLIANMAENFAAANTTQVAA